MYIITFECGCKMPYSEILKKKRKSLCPIHKISKKKEIFFRCEICGIETNTTEHGNPIKQIGVRYVCYGCRIKIFPLLRDGISIKQVIEDRQILSLLEKKRKKREVTKQKEVWCERKPDCKFYDLCLTEILKENEKVNDLPCSGCGRYEQVELFDVLNFLNTGQDFSYPAIM